MLRKLQERPHILVFSVVCFFAVFTLGYLRFPFGPPLLFSLELAGWQAMPWGLLLGVGWLMRRFFGAERANPWLLGVTLLLILFALYTYAPSLRPFDPDHPEHEPNIVFLIAPINIAIVVSILVAPVALMLAVQRRVGPKADDAH